MNCLGCVSFNANYEKELKDGLVTKRGCTDVMWILIFVAFMGGMGYILTKTFILGNPNRLIYGTDSWGNACDSNKNKKLDLPEIPDEVNGYDTTGLKKSFQFTYIPQMPTKIVCISDCPTKPVRNLNDIKKLSENGTHLCRYDVTDFGAYTVTQDMCPNPMVLEAFGSYKDVLNRCVPMMVYEKAMESGMAMAEGHLQSDCKTAGSVMERIASDWEKVSPMVVKLLLVTLLVAFVLTLIMSVIIGYVIKILLLAMIFSLIGITGIMWYNWYIFTENEKYINEQFYWAVGVSVVAIALLLILINLKKSIDFIIQLFLEGAAAVFNMPVLLFLPLVTLVLQFLSLVCLGFGFLYIYSAGDPKMENGNVIFEQNQELFKMQWYYFLGTLWIFQLFGACQIMVIAGSVAEWYFTRDKGFAVRPLLNATYRLVRFHMGTVLFGSFLIALVQWLKAIMLYMERQLKVFGENPLATIVMKVMACCFWCMEKIIKFLTKNAYIMTAIVGCNLCTGGWQAIKIIMSNMLKVGTLNTVGAFALFLTKLVIVVVMLIIGFFVFADYDICYLWVPLIPLGLAAFFIAHCFISVYGMTLDTIILCFCIDSEYNDGGERPFYMRKGLMRFLDKAADKYAKGEGKEGESKEENPKE